MNDGAKEEGPAMPGPAPPLILLLLLLILLVHCRREHKDDEPECGLDNQRTSVSRE